MQEATECNTELAPLMAAVRKAKGLASRELLDDQTFEALSQVLERRSVYSKECLIRQGDSGRSVYLIERGSARVYRSLQREWIQLAVLGAGSVIGEGTFFAQVPRPASVEMLEPAAVWELSSEGFDRLARNHPTAALNLCRFLGAVLASRMSSVTGRLSVT